MFSVASHGREGNVRSAGMEAGSIWYRLLSVIQGLEFTGGAAPEWHPNSRGATVEAYKAEMSCS